MRSRRRAHRVRWWVSTLLMAGLIAACAAPEEVLQPPGVLVTADPVQTEPPAHAAPFQMQGFTLAPRARFEITARVLSRADYRRDRQADLAPTDLALGWRRMSDTRVLEQLEIGQSTRWYHFHWRGQPPIPEREMARTSANVHIIPGSPEAFETLRDIRRGDVVTASGYLVDVSQGKEFVWPTSLSRLDTRNGACEILFAERLEIHPRPGS